MYEKMILNLLSCEEIQLPNGLIYPSKNITSYLAMRPKKVFIRRIIPINRIVKVSNSDPVNIPSGLATFRFEVFEKDKWVYVENKMEVAVVSNYAGYSSQRIWGNYLFSILNLRTKYLRREEKFFRPLIKKIYNICFFKYPNPGYAWDPLWDQADFLPTLINICERYLTCSFVEGNIYSAEELIFNLREIQNGAELAQGFANPLPAGFIHQQPPQPVPAQNVYVAHQAAVWNFVGQPTVPADVAFIEDEFFNNNNQ